MGLLPPPEQFDEHALTEYVELALLFEDEPHFSLAELGSRFPSGQRPTANDVGLIRSEVARRQHLFPEIYPYQTDDAGVRRIEAPGAGIYDFLAMLSLERAPFRVEKRFNEANGLFDILVREAMVARLQPQGKAVRFGTPVRDERPEKIEDAIPWLAKLMGLATGQEDLVFDDNDMGVDVVAWQPFAGGRSGFPVWLVQATTQLEYASKSMQIPVSAWSQAIDIGPRPQTGLAIPFTVRTGDDRWLKVSRNADLILERLRICESLASVDVFGTLEAEGFSQFLQTELSSWRQYVDDPDTTNPAIPKPRKQRPSSKRDPLRR